MNANENERSIWNNKQGIRKEYTLQFRHTVWQLPNSIFALYVWENADLCLSLHFVMKWMNWLIGYLMMLCQLQSWFTKWEEAEWLYEIPIPEKNSKNLRKTDLWSGSEASTPWRQIRLVTAQVSHLAKGNREVELFPSGKFEQ